MPEFCIAFLQASGGAMVAIVLFSLVSWLLRPRRKQ